MTPNMLEKLAEWLRENDGRMVGMIGNGSTVVVRLVCGNILTMIEWDIMDEVWNEIE
jgi:hypothetical protein